MTNYNRNVWENLFIKIEVWDLIASESFSCDIREAWFLKNKYGSRKWDGDNDSVFNESISIQINW